MIARHVVVRGRVQGVGFRWSAQTEAQSVGVVGWVRNRSDGSVEAVFEGDETAVEAMVEWARRGPTPARVEHIDVMEIDVVGLDHFVVRA